MAATCPFANETPWLRQTTPPRRRPRYWPRQLVQFNERDPQGLVFAVSRRIQPYEQESFSDVSSRAGVLQRSRENPL